MPAGIAARTSPFCLVCQSLCRALQIIARALMHRVPIYFSRFRLFSQVILVYNRRMIKITITENQGNGSSTLAALKI